MLLYHDDVTIPQEYGPMIRWTVRSVVAERKWKPIAWTIHRIVDAEVDGSLDRHDGAHLVCWLKSLLYEAGVPRKVGVFINDVVEDALKEAGLYGCYGGVESAGATNPVAG